MNRATLDLFDACAMGRADKARQALAGGADPKATNAQGFTAAIYATIEKSLACLALLAEHGADLNQSDRNGWSPAIYCADKRWAEGLRLLAALGADLEATDRHGRSPALFCSGHPRDFNCLNILAGAGVDLNRADSRGFTPAMFCAANHDLDGLAFFARHGVDFEREACDGRTALDYAGSHQPCRDFIQASIERRCLGLHAQAASAARPPKAL